MMCRLWSNEQWLVHIYRELKCLYKGHTDDCPEQMNGCTHSSAKHVSSWKLILFTDPTPAHQQDYTTAET